MPKATAAKTGAAERRPVWRFAGGPTNPGHWLSADGRFLIYPEYYGSSRPQGYRLHDDECGTVERFDTVREAKNRAARVALDVQAVTR